MIWRNSRNFRSLYWRILEICEKNWKKWDETVRYKISDDTVIENLTTKQFLSDIKTKQDLTKYLSMKLCYVFQNVAFAVSYEFTCISNISDIDARVKGHRHKETDACIVLYSLDVTKRKPFTDLAVYCCDTDILLVLLCCFDELCSSTIFRATNVTCPSLAFMH